ncbi:hypothetical protein Zmor_007731 [Zophobas morio]|uniref:glutathione transferase n=3 Tax=Zophobas morio TaxID=2755281 RepID=A0AA38MPQ1_9CUCU|nr:hypothetical protein Zmor_007731 [Zophobas morio]
MAPTYKLTYFDFCGLGEPCRFILSYGRIEFEDFRIKWEDWPQWRERTPFGLLPLLEHNGKQVNQSKAIARYLAKKVKLVGDDDWENLEIDAIVDTLDDLRQKVVTIFFEQDETKKEVLRQTVIKEHCPYYYSRLEKVVQKNGGHLALNRLTWADLYFAAISPLFDALSGNNNLSDYPNLTVLKERVNAIPAIKKWIETRPKSDF